MYKEVVTCSECEHFFINPEGISMCKNEKGLPFPNINDFCSNGKSSGTARQIDNSELLRQVYEQRRK